MLLLLLLLLLLQPLLTRSWHSPEPSQAMPVSTHLT
jgi:hypothetical protein